MSGTREGGLKTARTNMERHGNDFYGRIGGKGGQNGHIGGFSNRELARNAGAKGGRMSKRSRGVQGKLDTIFQEFIKSEIGAGRSIRAIATRIGVSENSIKRYLIKKGWLPEGYTVNIKKVVEK